MRATIAINVFHKRAGHTSEVDTLPNLLNLNLFIIIVLSVSDIAINAAPYIIEIRLNMIPCITVFEISCLDIAVDLREPASQLNAFRSNCCSSCGTGRNLTYLRLPNLPMQQWQYLLAC